MTVTNRETRQHTESEDPHWIEWATGLVSIVLVAVILVWIGSEALLKRDHVPDLSVSIRGVEKRGDFFVAVIRLDNKASATAAAVRVTGVLTMPDGATETSETTFDYAPAESSSNGGLLFRSDPASGKLDARPTGYTDP